MIIALGSDHAGYDYKKQLKGDLEKMGYTVIDMGPDDALPVDYPVYADKVCKAIQKEEANIGILICGTGIGMSMAANKQKGIRAAVCDNIFSSILTREHNNANILCIGARIIAYQMALEITKSFLSTEFWGGKHQQRIEMFDIPKQRNE